jgi:serine/threonine-protein kinase RsbW
MSERVVQLSFPARAEYLLLARLALSGVARGSRLDDEVLADLKLAVTEACGNAVRHAYADSVGDVLVRYSISAETLEMIVEDQGAGVDPEAPATTHPEEGGGMGMAIIGAIVDEFDVQPGSDGCGTVVRMIKRLSPSAA